MKNIYNKLLAIGFVLFALQANAQAPKYVLFEHFTQASSTACYYQNPIFESNILVANPNVVRHIAFHTSWPGTDVMYNANATEVDARVGYYNVTQMPFAVMLGNQKTGAPATITQADVDAQFSKGSPVKIEVSEVDNVTTRDLTVVIKTLGTVPTGNYKLYVAIVENPVNYATAPGTNGETHFPDVFRKMYPSIIGEPVTLAATGGSVTFNYTYTIDPTWVASNIKAVCYLQENTSKEVLNVGTIADPIINYSLINDSVEVANTAANVATSFTLASGNTANAAEDFVYTLTNDAPTGWASNFMVGTNSFTTTGNVNVAAGSTNNITINVTPNSTRGVATYTLTVSSVAHPSSPVMAKKVYVISGVTDLIVNNSGRVGDNTTQGSAANWEQTFIDGLAFANNQGYASTNDIVMNKAANSSALTGIKNIYYNVGWTFPGLTDANAAALQSFMDAGGNLFISGQDLAWSIADATSPYATTATQSFLTNYLHSNYVADGTPLNTQLATVANDTIFGSATIYGSQVGNATIIDTIYGPSNFSPDEITATATGVAIFNYANGTKVGGARAQTANYKMVFIVPGMEMLSASNSSEILKRTHDWFYGLSVGIDDINSSTMSIGQNYPNPSKGNTTIALDNIDRNLNLDVIDVTGKIVYNVQVAKGTKQVTLNTSDLSSGKYIYRFYDNDKFNFVKSMIVK